LATYTVVADSSSFFPSLGSFLVAAYRAHEGAPDRRLTRIAAAAPGVLGSESVGDAGGYLVPPEVGEIVRLSVEDSLLAVTLRRMTTSNSLTLAYDADAPWSVTGPVPSVKPAGALLTQRKPKVESRSVRLDALRVFVAVSSEMFEDAVGLEAYVTSAFQRRATFLINSWLLSGDGVAKPLGILNCGALITQIKEAGQSAATIVYANLTKMMSRLYAPARPRSIWVAHPGAMEYIERNWTGPAGTLVYDDRPRILGRPVYVSDAAQVLGATGDLVLLDPESILSVAKPTGPRLDVSASVYFDQHAGAMRLTLRFAAVQLWSAPISPFTGSTTVSSVVALEPR
jgi:HK97 family phage major capsid protein